MFHVTCAVQSGCVLLDGDGSPDAGEAAAQHRQGFPTPQCTTAQPVNTQSTAHRHHRSLATTTHHHRGSTTAHTYRRGRHIHRSTAARHHRDWGSPPPLATIVHHHRTLTTTAHHHRSPPPLTTTAHHPPPLSSVFCIFLHRVERCRLGLRGGEQQRPTDRERGRPKVFHQR